MKATQISTPESIFKPWIVKRPKGGCQVLFPLTELDRILGQVFAKLQAENLRLRKIAAHVPSRTYIAAKEAAGYGEAIHARRKS